MAAVVGLALVASGCVSTIEHERQVNALKSQLGNALNELAEARDELAAGTRAHQQKLEELGRTRDEAEELAGILAALEHAKQERERSLREMEDLVRDISGMRIEPRAEGDFIVIENEILFDAGQIKLKDDARETIRTTVVPYIKDQLRANPEQMIRVDGHSDGQPIRLSPWDDNYHLSVMRAHSVLVFLGEEGIPLGNMFLAGFGPNQPLVEPAAPEAAVAANRRVEILLVPRRDEDIQSILDAFIR